MICRYIVVFPDAFLTWKLNMITSLYHFKVLLKHSVERLVNVGLMNVTMVVVKMEEPASIMEVLSCKLINLDCTNLFKFFLNNKYRVVQLKVHSFFLLFRIESKNGRSHGYCFCGRHILRYMF